MKRLFGFLVMSLMATAPIQAGEANMQPISKAEVDAVFKEVEPLVASCDAGDIAACRIGFATIDAPAKRIQDRLNATRAADPNYRYPDRSDGESYFFGKFGKIVVQLGMAGCIRDHGYSCYRIAFANLQGADGMAIGDLEALKNPLEKSCKLGSVDGCAALTASSKSSKKTLKEQRPWRAKAQMACAGKSANGCSVYGHMLLDGYGGEKDLQEAVPLLSFACEEQHAMACNTLGRMHETGNGVSQDLVRAMKFYETGCYANFGGGNCRLRDKMKRRLANSAIE